MFLALCLNTREYNIYGPSHLSSTLMGPPTCEALGWRPQTKETVPITGRVVFWLSQVSAHFPGSERVFHRYIEANLLRWSRTFDTGSQV